MKHRASCKTRLKGAFFLVWVAVSLAPLAAQSIPQKFLGDVAHPPSFRPRFKPIQYRDVTIRYDESAWEKWFSGAVTANLASEITELNLIVSGKDKKGRPWTVYIAPPQMIAGGEAAAADLNSDGTDELIFDMGLGRNGWCAGGSEMTVLSFDSEGRPVPWFVIGYSEPDLDFGDWNKNGRNELVQFDCDFDSSQDVPKWFSVASVYELNNAFWLRLSQKDRAKYESQYRALASRTKRIPLGEDPSKFFPDYSNDPAAGVTEHILSTVPGVGDERCGVLEGLEIEDGRLVEMGEREKQQLHARCFDHFVIEDGVNCYGKPAIVIYSPKETIAVLDGSSDRAAEMFQQIVREKLPVKLTGQLEEGHCSPAMIWATKP